MWDTLGENKLEPGNFEKRRRTWAPQAAKPVIRGAAGLDLCPRAPGPAAHQASQRWSEVRRGLDGAAAINIRPYRAVCLPNSRTWTQLHSGHVICDCCLPSSFLTMGGRNRRRTFRRGTSENLNFECEPVVSPQTATTGARSVSQSRVLHRGVFGSEARSAADLPRAGAVDQK